MGWKGNTEVGISYLSNSEEQLGGRAAQRHGPGYGVGTKCCELGICEASWSSWPELRRPSRMLGRHLGVKYLNTTGPGSLAHVSEGELLLLILILICQSEFWVLL